MHSFEVKQNSFTSSVVVLLDAVSLLEGWEMCPGLDRGTLPFRAAISRFLNYSIHITHRWERRRTFRCSNMKSTSTEVYLFPPTDFSYAHYRHNDTILV